MEYIVGITLALLVCGAAKGLGMDRERVFYPVLGKVCINRRRLCLPEG